MLEIVSFFSFLGHVSLDLLYMLLYLLGGFFLALDLVPEVGIGLSKVLLHNFGIVVNDLCVSKFTQCIETSILKSLVLISYSLELSLDPSITSLEKISLVFYFLDL